MEDVATWHSRYISTADLMEIACLILQNVLPMGKQSTDSFPHHGDFASLVVINSPAVNILKNYGNPCSQLLGDRHGLEHSMLGRVQSIVWGTLWRKSGVNCGDATLDNKWLTYINTN